MAGDNDDLPLAPQGHWVQMGWQGARAGIVPAMLLALVVVALLADSSGWCKIATTCYKFQMEDTLPSRVQLGPGHFLLRRIELMGVSTKKLGLYEDSPLEPEFAPEVTTYQAATAHDRLQIKVEFWDPDVELHVAVHIRGCDDLVDTTYTVSAQTPKTVTDKEGPTHFTSEVSSGGKMWRSVTIGPLDYAWNNITLVASLWSATERTFVTHNITLMVHHPAPDRNMHLKGMPCGAELRVAAWYVLNAALEVAGGVDACLQYDRSGTGQVGVGARSLFILTHCRRATIPRIYENSSLPFENTYVLYLKHHISQARIIPKAVSRCAKVHMNGQAIPRGAVSPVILIDDSQDQTMLKIQVTAEDGREGWYKLYIVRLAAMPPPPPLPAYMKPPPPKGVVTLEQLKPYLTAREFEKGLGVANFKEDDIKSAVAESVRYLRKCSPSKETKDPFDAEMGGKC